MRIKQRITPVSGDTRVEEREAEKQKQPTIHKYLAHLTVLYAKILERKMETALEKRVVNNDDFRNYQEEFIYWDTLLICTIK